MAGRHGKPDRCRSAAAAAAAAGRPTAPHPVLPQPFLARVCGGMGVGELLHGPTFSLFDSTTAIEIGDPKMDIGLQRSEEVGSAEELIAGGAAPVDLAPARALAVMDRLLCLDATWHAGSMLTQTVFTSLYMLQPERCGGAVGGARHASVCLKGAGRSACLCCCWFLQAPVPSPAMPCRRPPPPGWPPTRRCTPTAWRCAPPARCLSTWRTPAR